MDWSIGGNVEIGEHGNKAGIQLRTKDSTPEELAKIDTLLDINNQ
jgi:hypothetical protein